MTVEPDQSIVQSIAQLWREMGSVGGKLDSLQTAITLYQAGNERQSRHIEMIDERMGQRIEALDLRINTIEGRLATREDLKVLSDQIAALATAKAEDRGRLSALGGFSSQLAPWAAVLIALLALVGSWRNRGDIIRQAEQHNPPPVHQER